MMRLFIDINHPAQVHLFREPIRQWKSKGYEILVAARDKDVTFDLLNNYGIEFKRTAAVRQNALLYPFAVIELDLKIFRLAKQFDPDFLLGTSFAIAHVSKLIRGRSIVLSEDDFDSSRLFWLLVKPFADIILTPDSLPDDFGYRHYKYPSYHELAYLHPNHFEPNADVLRESGISKSEPFSIMRFVSLRASHDQGHAGIDEKLSLRIFDLLSEHGKVFLSSEGELPPKLQSHGLRIPSHKMHDLLFFAQILVSDSQTMSVEAAVLGVPSVRINTMVGRIPVLEELEKKYYLTNGFFPYEKDAILSKIAGILTAKNYKKQLSFEREKLLEEKTDFSRLLVDFVEELKSRYDRI